MPENNSQPNNQPTKQDIKILSIQTLAMLEPILQEKQFAIANLKISKKLNRISPEDYETQNKTLSLEVYSLQKRIVREADILAAL